VESDEVEKGRPIGKPAQPVYTTPEAEGFTQQEINELIAEIESDEYDINENSILFIRPPTN
jgi:hypothetical protein